MIPNPKELYEGIHGTWTPIEKFMHNFCQHRTPGFLQLQCGIFKLRLAQDGLVRKAEGDMILKDWSASIANIFGTTLSCPN